MKDQIVVVFNFYLFYINEIGYDDYIKYLDLDEKINIIKEGGTRNFSDVFI